MPANEKRVPLRMCVGCREMKPKRELIRVVKPQEGDVAIDRKGKAPGRGAYVCPDPGCMKRAAKSHALEKALSCAIAPEIYEALAAQLESGT